MTHEIQPWDSEEGGVRDTGLEEVCDMHDLHIIVGNKFSELTR
jgi:hypothetical protein